VTVRESVVVLVKLPEVPVIVTVAVPVVAIPLAVSVKVLELAGLVVLAGLKEGVTPAGNTEETDKLTLPVKPFSGETEMVLPPLAPWTIDKVFGEAEREKLGTAAAVTARETVVVFVRVPEVPVIMTVAVPVAAVLLAVRVTMLEFAGLVMLVGLKDAVTPMGKPEADKLTLPVKAFTEATEIVLVPLAPCAIDKLDGDEERENPGTGPPVGQLFTKLVAFSVPMPVAKSQPVVVPYAGLKELLEAESTPCVPGPEGL
jgi:hypothetical protein